jgi:diguanylate cyclase (GGDEF)-like protein/PAS domain S-box-containing protein
LIALIVGLIITGALVSNAFERLLVKEKEKFITQAAHVYDRIAQRLSSSEESLFNLSTFFNSSSNVDSEHFRLFTHEILSRHEFVQSSQYLPLVPYERRSEFESSMHREGYVTFSISEYRNGRYITAPPREQYYPVLYQEPFTPYTASMMGFDVLSNSNISSSVMNAIESGNVTSVYDVDHMTNEGYYILIKALYTGKEIPAHVKNRRKDVNGLLMLRIDTSALIKDIPDKDHFELAVYMNMANTGERLTRIAQHIGKNLHEEDEWLINWNSHSYSTLLPGGEITLDIRSPVHWQDTDNEAVVMSGFLGLLLMLLLITGSNVILFRTRKLQDINQKISHVVEQRTEELQLEKDSLEHEMQIRQQDENRLLKQQESMLKLSTSHISRQGELESALQKITEIAAQTLAVERVSIWLFNNDDTELKCIDLYIKSLDQHSSGMILKQIDYPNYFSSLKTGRPIAADDARFDLRTREFADDYLQTMDIHSMLDAPLRREGQVVGVVCHEQVSNRRKWKLDEQNFSRSVGDMVSLEMERHERKQAESKTIKLSSALEHAADSVFITDTDGYIEYTNPAFEKITGFSNDDVIGKSAQIVSSGKHGKEFYQKLWNTILSGHEYRDIFINRKKDGSVYYEEKTISPLHDDNGDICNFVSVGKDITERMQTQERLHFLAHHDLLTELPNRAMLIERLNHAINHTQVRNDSLAVMFLDLDRFKVINDTLGHDVGDQLIKKVADRLRPCVRNTDTVARIGGDEFVILLEDIQDISNISSIANNVLETLAQPFLLEGRELFVTCSIGIGIYPQDGQDSNTLLKNADTAMYRAKDQGRNNVQLYSADMSSRTLEQLTLETDLRHALERKQFMLLYQPLVDLNNGMIVGFETLIRWQHPELGMISPVDFIPILEETGLIIPVGEWVLRTACEQNRQWQMEGLPALPVAVNLSARQFSDANLAGQISTILSQTRLDPASLHLEITESVIMNNASSTYRVLDELNRLGVHLAVDDFGTGYSSLSYLKRFPIHILKIDRSFVRDITTDPDDASIVSTVITLAHSLKLKVVAEGVETEEQALFLRNKSCDIAQGYLYSKPISAEKIAVLLTKQSLTRDKIDELSS